MWSEGQNVTSSHIRKAAAFSTEESGWNSQINWKTMVIDDPWQLTWMTTNQSIFPNRVIYLCWVRYD